MICNTCANTELFITERWYMHWVTVDGEHTVISRDEVQGDEQSYETPRSPYTECARCNSTDVTEQE